MAGINDNVFGGFWVALIPVLRGTNLLSTFLYSLFHSCSCMDDLAVVASVVGLPFPFILAIFGLLVAMGNIVVNMPLWSVHP